MTEKQIVWYILLTEVKIDSDTQSVTSLSVAPLAVLPEFQRKGIGGDVDSVSQVLLNNSDEKRMVNGIGYASCKC